MEFPNSTHVGDSSLKAAKTFLDNERGDTNENISDKKNEVAQFIEKQSENKVQDISDKVGEQNSETLGKSDLEEDKNPTDKTLNNGISNDSQIETSEKEKFSDSKRSAGIFGGEFKNNESGLDSVSKKGVSNDGIEENRGESSGSQVKDGEQQDAPSTVENNKTDQEEKEEWMDILGTGQLKKKVIKQGEPDSRPQKSDACLISLVGKLEDGTIFEQQNNFEINLGDNEIVQGLDFALALMDKNEEAEVMVASRFGYGTIGFEPLVPPEATLYYTITLLDVKPEPLISTLNIIDRLAIGRRKKERGNWLYGRDENTLAINSYRRALDYLDDTDFPVEPTDEQVQMLLEERFKTYNNLGAAQMKICAYDAALLSIENVLNCQPKNVKALFRKSKILKEKGELPKSIELIRQALAIEPDSKSFQHELSSLLALQRKDNTKQRDLYKKMMGSSSQGNDAEKKKKTPQNAFKLIAALSFAVAVIGAIVYKYRL